MLEHGKGEELVLHAHVKNFWIVNQNTLLPQTIWYVTILGLQSQLLT